VKILPTALAESAMGFYKIHVKFLSTNYKEEQTLRTECPCLIEAELNYFLHMEVWFQIFAFFVLATMPSNVNFGLTGKWLS
jgi:hypothetical protein